MLKKHFAQINFLRISLDALTIALIWNLSYFFRFYSGLFPHSGIPAYSKHLMLTIPIVMILFLCRHWTGIYKSIRVEPTFRQFSRQIESILLGYIFVILFLYYTEEVPYTRILLLLFFVFLMIGLTSSHFVLILGLRYIRTKGYNQRYYGIIGTGKAARQLLQDIESCSYYGLNCSFFIDDDPSLEGTYLDGIRVYGHIDQIVTIASNAEIDEIYLAKSGTGIQRIHPMLEKLQCAGITVRILPDWGELTSLSRPATLTIGSSILFTASDSPLTGMNIILKDLFDRSIALFLLCLFSLPILAIALLIKCTSRGPVFFLQKRMGMNRKEFRIIKFRTMKVSKTSKQYWTIRGDNRRTKVGVFLRSTSLDELPQLINVLKGDMSLVGPRPEQPRFVEKFSEEYKHYMLRHKVKSGITGWAQIHGFRGDTSLKKRVQYDLHYIRHWSLWLDLLILIRTPFHVFQRKNAY